MAWGQFWESVVRFQWEKAAPWMGLRNAVGVTAPIAIGAAFDALPAGISAATGALNVAFTDSGVPYAQRAKRMLAASAVVGIGVFAGAAFGQSPWLTPIVTAWAFAAGLLVALDQTAADLGTISLVTVLVFAGIPTAPDQAVLAGLLAVGGGILQTALSVARWPLRPYAPERRALAELFQALAESASGSTRASAPPAATAQSTHAQETLDTLDRDRSIEAERLRALLSQAERIRLALVALARLRRRLETETPAIDRFFELTAATLRSLATGAPKAPPPEMRDTIETMRQMSGQIVRDARRQMDALAGQLRAAADLAGRTGPAGESQFAEREAAQSWRLRLKGTFATLRANLSLQSAAFRHAIRLAICVAIGETIGLQFGLSRSYWAPMTIAIVLKPDFSSTFSRGVLRLAGTILGLLLATALFHVEQIRTYQEVAVLGVAFFVVRAYGAANYGIAATAITALVVALMALVGVAPNSLIVPRAVNTVVGGAVALTAYALWPTWERAQLSETIARMLDAYREYFHLVRRAYEQTGGPPWAALDRARLAARRARTNLEASVERAGAEPGVSSERLRVIGGLMANSHRLAHAMMALEAGLSASPPTPARTAFGAFATDVEMTLGLLAGSLRGGQLDLAALPDLREDHDALIAASESENARHALVNVETDRVANSLNTLAVDVVRWKDCAAC